METNNKIQNKFQRIVENYVIHPGFNYRKNVAQVIKLVKCKNECQSSLDVVEINVSEDVYGYNLTWAFTSIWERNMEESCIRTQFTPLST